MGVYILWLILFLVYGLSGLYVLVQLNEKWPDAFKEVMGAPLAACIGLCAWPLSALLVPFNHRMKTRQELANGYSKN